jgi:hypothetical protein
VNINARIVRDAARNAEDFTSPFLLIRIMRVPLDNDYSRDAALTVLSLGVGD